MNASKQIALVRVKKGIHYHLPEWIPVYWPSHRDPEISPHAAAEHFHIAWNRMAVYRRRFYTSSHGPAAYPVWAKDVVELIFPTIELPIRSKPCVMKRKEFPELKVSHS